MKKYSQRILACLLIVSLVGNVYLFSQLNEYKERQQQDYKTNVNHFYGHFWQMEYRLNDILDEKNKSEPDIVRIASNVTSLKNEVWRADEKIGNMEKYSTVDEELQVYRIPDLLFIMYFSYRINHLEAALHDNTVEDLFEVAEEIRKEYIVVRDILPKLDEDFIELSNEEQIAIWVEIVKQLPESEELEAYKDFIRFDWLVEEYYGLDLN